MYLSSAEDSNRRGRLLGRWKDRVKEYMSEGAEGNIKCNRREKTGKLRYGNE